MPEMDPKLAKMIEGLAVRVEREHESSRGEIDKRGVHTAVLDVFEEEYEDIVPVALRVGWYFFVWEVLRKRYGKSRSKGVAEMMFEDEDDADQQKLPSQEWAEFAVYNVPVGGGNFEARRLVMMSTEEVRAARREYEKRGREMFQQAKPLRAYEREMDRREFRETDTVQDLYRKTA